MPAQTEIVIPDTPDELYRAAAGEFSKLAFQAVQSKGKFSVALAGGSTPKGLYELLASGFIPNIPWDKVYFFFGDERHVPPDDPQSNYRMAYQALLSKLPQQNVFRVHAEEKDPAVAAAEYEQLLREFFNLKAGEFPRFDLILLGLGPDGHTASLFPGSAALNEDQRLVVANWSDRLHANRITFTYPVLNHAARIMFLVSGADKTGVLHEVLENPRANLPAQKVCPVNGSLIWLIDRAAASALTAITPKPAQSA